MTLSSSVSATPRATRSCCASWALPRSPRPPWRTRRHAARGRGERGVIRVPEGGGDGGGGVLLVCAEVPRAGRARRIDDCARATVGRSAIPCMSRAQRSHASCSPHVRASRRRARPTFLIRYSVFGIRYSVFSVFGIRYSYSASIPCMNLSQMYTAVDRSPDNALEPSRQSTCN